MSKRKKKAEAYSKANCPVVQQMGLNGAALRLYVQRRFGQLRATLGPREFGRLYALHEKHNPEEVQKARERRRNAPRTRRSTRSGLIYTQRQEKPVYSRSFSDSTYS